MISMKWVKDYVDLEGEDLNELAVKITKAGVNVEKVITTHMDNVVVGEVVDCIDHPDSDHLHVCQVLTGDKEPRQIVCGASNVRKGIKVIVALPGAVLPGDFKIESGAIRGQKSDGMICALFELGLEEKTEETYAKGIAELDSDATVGMNALEYLGLDDTVYELDVHKHKNNDCYYHIGFAYEVATILNKKVTLPKSTYKENKDDVKNYVSLKVDTELCPYYLGRMVKNVKVGESPKWMQERLISAGMRPINNVVDISNFVMLEFGQPTHFFDADKLGKTVLVRNAKENEKIVTLDNVERELKTNDIVITDGTKPTCIAGIMGGENVEVDDSTKNIFIEAAIFDAFAIRKTSSRLNLQSEASTRYGKGLDYEYTNMAMDRCLELLEKYADGEVVGGELKHDKVDKTPKVVEFQTEKINSILGIEISTEDMEHELDRLGFEYKLNKDVFTVTIPFRRLDIESNVEDIAEEIGRLYGYHNLVCSLPVVPTRRGVYVGDVAIRKAISRRLRSLGINEVKTYTLVSPAKAAMFNYDNKEYITLPNPLSTDKSVIRTTILPSLLETYNYNKARKVQDVMIYEIAKTYDANYEEESKVAILMKGNYIKNEWNHTVLKADFYVLKGIVENLLDYLGFKNRYRFEAAKLPELHPGISAKIIMDNKDVVGVIGRVHPSVAKDDIYVAELSMKQLYEKQVKPLKYKEASKYPGIEKDVAFIMPNETESETVKTQIKHSGGRLLTDIKEFDLYNEITPGNKSIAYKLTFMDPTRTLSDEEVMEVFNKIISETETKCNVKLRSM